MTETETNYEYVTHDGKKILVDAAIRDGDGYNIAGTYPKKVDIRCKPGTTKELRIAHGLGKAPSAVSLYVIKHGNTEAYTRIEADMEVTDNYIDIKFTELPTAPDAQPLELLVRSLI